jgi:hypothetical protein
MICIVLLKAHPYSKTLIAAAATVTGAAAASLKSLKFLHIKQGDSV